MLCYSVTRIGKGAQEQLSCQLAHHFKGLRDFYDFYNYTLHHLFFVVEQIFFIFCIGTIYFDVQNPKASCRSSVNSVQVYTG